MENAKHRVILWQNTRYGKSRSACVYERNLTGVAVQIQVKYLRYQLENKVEEWTHHIMCSYVACVPQFFLLRCIHKNARREN
jgi:hypothetical protein